jgi:phosphopantothenoylcysteine decarboxylase/phosphopantothenate--cysteine ligase
MSGSRRNRNGGTENPRRRPPRGDRRTEPAVTTEPPRPASPTTPLRVLVAYGPTHEPIDDVRFIGNRSSGRMGLAIADAFAAAGCAVTAAAGPGTPAPAAGRTLRFRTAADLLALLRAEWPAHDVLVMAAAVADYRPRSTVAGKMRREDGARTLELEPTEDILAGLAAGTRPDQFVVGFALERPDELEASAAAKLGRKRADAIVANPLGTMDAPDVDGAVLLAGQPARWLRPGAPLPKPAFATWLVRELLPMAHARRGVACR